MSIAYGRFLLNLTAAGEQVIQQRLGYIQVVEFQDATGAVKLDGKIEVQIDGANAPFLPLRYNGKVLLPERTEWVRVKWDLQADTYCLLLTAPEPNKLVGDFPNPKQLVTSSVGTSVAVAEVTCDNTVDLLAAADAARQSLLLKNISGTTAYLGPVGVTAATGYQVDPGEEFRVDKSTAAIYGITAAGVATFRRFVES